MDIQQMHMVFRTMAQQAGLQLVRGVLPEAIDVYLNDAIFEMTRQELLSGAKTVFQDNVNLQTTAIGPINILRSLYRTIDICLTPDNKELSGLNTGENNYINNTNQLVPWIKCHNNDIGYYEVYLPTQTYGLNPTAKDAPYEKYKDTFINVPYVSNPGIVITPMMYLGCSLQYTSDSMKSVGGRNGITFDLGTKGYGHHVATRLIGGDTLETTFRDYCNGASVANPVVSLMSDAIGHEYVEIYTNTKDLIVSTLTVKYIKLPQRVQYSTNPEECSNCDLPAYIHYEIVRRAVAKYLTTMYQGNVRDDNGRNN